MELGAILYFVRHYMGRAADVGRLPGLQRQRADILEAASALTFAPVGSLAGFLLGCAAAVLVCVAAPAVGSHVGATALVVPAGLVAALLGAAVGVAAARRT